MSTYTEHEQRIQAIAAIMAGSVPSAPVMLPTYEELTALGDRIVAECNARLVRLGEPPMSEFSTTCLRHDIVGAMIDVRHEASDYASDKTWKRVSR